MLRRHRNLVDNGNEGNDLVTARRDVLIEGKHLE